MISSPSTSDRELPAQRAAISRPFVSVITVCFNAERYLEQCVQSVLAQDFADFEYLVIDGGSKDGTLRIIERYASSLAYWHSKPDRGIADAFNIGVRESRGEWLMFVNADDYLHDLHALSSLAAQARQHPEADVVYGQVIFVTRERSPRPIGRPYGAPFSWFRLVLWRAIPHPAALTSRRFFDRVGRFDESYLGADYELYLRGGPDLKALHTPVPITCMREGGASRAQLRQILRDWYRSVTGTRALSPVVAWPLYCLFFFRLGARRVKRHVLDFFRGRTAPDVDGD